jgi:hypothetical protein
MNAPHIADLHVDYQLKPKLRELLYEYKDVFTQASAGNQYITPSYEFDVETNPNMPIR